ncbi:hypothetical protein Poly51_16110 [Rubripirellula tenax]|uniref:Chromosome partition protein Smc n=1 Tax=Rubripirellula tenax TaxID=2528015 RepID=A0A5C6FGX9_9BACT|nr:hypothetical protein [Rubripirellula tenax]TWU58831.1 hypothetical protein Poly51_16110 [Rubripirellula tenax]
MPISGPVVHQQLMDAYSQTQALLESVRARITEATQQRDQLDDTRSESLVKLAEFYLPDLTPESIRATWVEVQPAMSQVFRRKQQQCDHLHTELTKLDARRQTEDATLLTINHDLDELIESQKQLADQVEQQLRQDGPFVELADRAAVAEAALERAEANLHEIEQDSARKLPAYEASTLFKYLQDRKFGTAEYKHRGFTRRMDRWVGKMVDYNKAKQGYDFLKKTPEQMRQIIADDRQSLDVVMDELERRRDHVAAGLGLPAKIEANSAMQRRRDDQIRILDKLIAETNLVQSQLTEADDPRGTYYREAIDLFRNMLQQIDSRDLKRRATSTIDLTDDQIVAQLMNVEAKVGSYDEAAQQHQNETLKIQAFLEDMGRLIQQFRSAGFDSARSQFVGTLDVPMHVNRAIQSGNAEMLWSEIRSAQRWGPTAMEQITAVATHPMTQVLINAMAHAAGGALQEHARRAGRRRNTQDRSWIQSGGSSSGRGSDSSWGGGIRW